MRDLKSHIIFLVVIGCFLLGACEKSGQVVHMNLQSFSIENQRKIGQTIKTEIYNNEQFSILAEEAYPGAYAYLNTMLKTLLTTPEVNRREVFDWSINILYNDDLLTTFTLPGGHVFISTGLLKFINAENELLSILAHEICYVDTDHAIVHLASEIKDGGFVLGDIVLDNDVPELPEIAHAASTLKYRNEEVIGADNYAIQLLCPFQYDAEGLRTIIEQANSELKDMHWLNVRPSSMERIDNIINKASICGTGEAVFLERYQEFINEDLP